MFTSSSTGRALVLESGLDGGDPAVGLEVGDEHFARGTVVSAGACRDLFEAVGSTSDDDEVVAALREQPGERLPDP